MLDNEKFYLSAYKKYGISAKGLNWNSKESQEKRFEIITSLLAKDLKNSSVLDVGCGFGDILTFWQMKNNLPKNYTGIDPVEKFVKTASKRFKKLKSVSFLHKSIFDKELPKATYCIASGSLNILNEFDTWLFLENMLQLSTKGIVFNILKGDKKSENFNYKTEDEMIDFFEKKGLEIVIVNDYLPNDMTIKALK